MEVLFLFMLLSVTLTAFISIVFNYITLSLANKYELYDKPDYRKIHSEPIPRLGGVAIFASFFLSIIPSFFLAGKISDLAYLKELITPKMILLILGVVSIFITGFIDDIKNISAKKKLLGQSIAALFVIFAGVEITEIPLIPTVNTLQLGGWSYVFTFLWIVGMTNAINLIDGLDGLASGVSILALAFYTVYFWLYGSIITMVICLILLGAVLGFYIFNFPPAKMFLGDSGSLLMGFLLSILPFMPSVFDNAYLNLPLYVPTTLLMLPILDVINAIIRRKHRSLPVMTPDKDHYHHKLLSAGYNNLWILTIVYSDLIIAGVVIYIALIVPPYQYSTLSILLVWYYSIVKMAYLYLTPVKLKSMRVYQMNKKKHVKKDKQLIANDE